MAQDSAEPKLPEATQAHLGKGYDALNRIATKRLRRNFRPRWQPIQRLTLRARFPLAVALFESHKPEEARKEFEIVRKEVGDHPNVLYYLGRMDLDGLDYASAIRNLSKAVAKPPFPDTAYFLGLAYFKQGDLPNAEKWLHEAERANPSDARVPYQLGFVYRKQGLEEKAKEVHGPLAAPSPARHRPEPD